MKSFNEISSFDKNSVMILDALNLAFRWKHSHATEFLDDYLRTVESLRKSYKTSKIIIACDSGSSSYRKGIFPDYKKARKEKYEKQTEEERLEFEEFFAEFTKIIETYIEDGTYLVLKFKGCEADDIAAYVTGKYRKKKNIWLVSSDKDWDLLIHPNVSRFSYVTRKEITNDNWSDFYEYAPEDHISIKCLTGDTGDSIPGVSGIGPKKAHALIKEYGSTYDIIASMPITSRYKHIQNLNEFGTDKLLLNYKLMDLETYCDEALGQENCQTIDKLLVEYLGD